MRAFFTDMNSQPVIIDNKNIYVVEKVLNEEQCKDRKILVCEIAWQSRNSEFMDLTKRL